jgi:hypothetical protein
MATRKAKTNGQWLKDSIAALEKKRDESPVVAERWYVTEAWNSSEDDLGAYVSGGQRRVSDVYDNQDDALAWIEEHDPAPGTQFKIIHQNKRVITREEWVSW